MEKSNLPLAGIRILDLTTSYAGPFCTMFLADMGADVVKIEEPKMGDDSRHWGPPFFKDVSPWFLSTNRNKRSISLNIREPRGLEILKSLVIRIKRQLKQSCFEMFLKMEMFGSTLAICLEILDAAMPNLWIALEIIFAGKGITYPLQK